MSTPAEPASRVSPASRRGRARSGRRAGDSGTREAILDAARTRFAEHGYDGATIRAIAADAAVDPALVHHFYGTKERLFSAAMRLPVVPSEVLDAAFAEAARRGDSFSPGEHLVRTALSVWENSEVLSIFTGLLRSALTSEAAASMFREFITDAILGPVAAMARARAAGHRDEPARGRSKGMNAPTTPLYGYEVRNHTPPEGPSAAGAGAGAGGAGAAGAGDAADAAYRAAAVASQMVGLALTRYVLRLGPIATAGADDLVATVGPTIDRYLDGDLRAAPGRPAEPG